MTQISLRKNLFKPINVETLLKVGDEDVELWRFSDALKKTSLTSKTKDQYSYSVYEFLMFLELIDIDISEVTEADVELYREILLKRGHNMRSVKTKITRVAVYWRAVSKIRGIDNKKICDKKGESPRFKSKYKEKGDKMEVSKERMAYIERIKFLLSTEISELNSDDKINLILMKVVLSADEYRLLKRWCISKGRIEPLAKEFRTSSTHIKGEISKIITKLKPFIWSHKNSPLISDKKKINLEKNKSVWLGDLVLKDIFKF